jgi:hypothetical protein
LRRGVRIEKGKCDEVETDDELLLLAGCLSGLAPLARAFYNPSTGWEKK